MSGRRIWSRMALGLMAVGAGGIAGLGIRHAVAAHEERAVVEGATQSTCFDFRTDLPSDAEARQLTRNFMKGAPPRLPHENLLLQDGPGLLPPGGGWDGRTDAWPEEVMAQLRIAASAQRAQFEESPPPPEKLQRHAWRGLLRDGGEFYLVEFAGGSTAPNDYWFTVRTDTGRVAPIVQRTAQWMECSRRGVAPTVQQVDLDLDGRMELVFPQFDHNGTVTSDDVLEYFAIDDVPTLQPVLRLRTSRWCSVVSHGENGYVRATLCSDASDELRMLVWFENPSVDLPLVAIGDAVLRRTARGQRYEVVSKHPALPGALDSYLEP